MGEREPKLTRSVIRWAESFNDKALKATDAFYTDFNIEQSLNLTRNQEKVFLAYFAHYWVLKKNVDSGRMARDPMYEQMLKVPVLKTIANGIYTINDGVNLAAQTLLEHAQKYATELQDNSHFDLRNAANILSSIYLSEEGRGDDLNQRIDRALSRIRIGKSAASPT